MTLLADRALTPAERMFSDVRRVSAELCRTLVTEDFVVQSMPDVSPTKWHLGHTTWFFETFILSKFVPGYQPFDPAFKFLFNSYYVSIGDRHCRQNRGQLSRPTVEDVFSYRRHVDAAMTRFLSELDPVTAAEVLPLIDIGVHHEQQHQELMLMDIKHVFWVNPLRPAYRPAKAKSPAIAPPMRWVSIKGGLHEIGHAGDGFAFDNESPRHTTYFDDFQIGSRLVTNGEFKKFIEDGGYTRAELWLSAGIATVKAEGWEAPLYWIKPDGEWLNHTLAGLLPVDDNEPVVHLSYYEADAFARWAGARLPTEAEWEIASETVSTAGNFSDDEYFQPRVANGSENIQQMFGDVWEWTGSAYLGYPGYRPAPGALGEYNGKFMNNQYVLRGGACVTPSTHIRRTYRNFFPPDARWQFGGLRLAR